MEYFMPVFLCFFTAQCCLLAVIRKVYGNSAVQKYPPYEICGVKQYRQYADSLDWEIFLSAIENGNFKLSAVFGCGSRNIISLYQNAENCVFPNDTNSKIYSSYIYKSLKMLLPYGMPFSELKEYVSGLVKTQYYSGGAPEYTAGGRYICCKGAAGVMVPLITSLYCNYTGDADFFNETLCYNAVSSRPVSSISGTSFCENVYTHCIKAVYGISLNGYGLINMPHKDSLAELIGLDGEFCDIAASLLYCFSCESFLPYMENCGERLEIINRIREIKNNITQKLANYLDTENPSESFNRVLVSVFYLLSGGGADRKKVLDSIKKLILKGGLKEKFSEKGSVTLKILLAFIFLKEKEFKAADLLTESLLTHDSFNPLEALLIKCLLFSGYFGLKFKCGYLSVKPAADSFKILFDHNGKAVNIDYGKDAYSGLTIDGLRFNNLDYICLKGYNKDINIRLGAV